MTASTFTHLPLAAGSAVAASLGRAGLWIFARYMRAPLASTGLLALVTLTALAASNALYFQTVRHPAPLFSPSQDVPVAVTAPAAAPALPPLPSERTAVVAPQPAAETTGSIAAPAPVVPDAPVGNRDAFAVQKKLTELGLFSGTVDGFYGPMTANAIRAFEERNGLEPTGALNPAVVEAILKADASGIVPVPQAAAVPAPAPRTIRPEPVQQAAITPPAPIEPVARAASLSPVDTAVDTVGTAATETIDSILAAVTSTTPAAAATPPRPAVALGSSAPVAAQPKPVQVASLEPMTAPVAAPLAAAAEPAAPQQAAVPEAAAPPIDPANNVELVSQIQRGLASLGFYHGSIDGRPGDTTARAIREFENFHSYQLTGQVKPDLVALLRDAGASL